MFARLIIGDIGNSTFAEFVGGNLDDFCDDRFKVQCLAERLHLDFGMAANQFCILNELLSQVIQALCAASDQAHAHLHVIRQIFLLKPLREQREAARNIGERGAQFVGQQLDHAAASIIQVILSLLPDFLVAL